MVWENNFFYILVLNAITGCVAYFLCKLAIHWTQERYGCYGLYYRLLIGVEVFFTVPFAYLYVRLIKGANIYFYKGISGYDGNEIVAAIFHILFLVWAIGAAKKSIQFIKKYGQLRKMCVSNVPHYDAKLEQLFRSTYPHHRLKKVTMFQNYSVSSPCIIGVFRPKLIIPEKEYSEDVWRIILAHEATHVVYKDNFWKWLSMIIVISCWWNPLIYPIVNEWADWTETHCDITVCNRFLGGDCQTYSIALTYSGMASEHIFSEGKSSFAEKNTVLRRISRLSKMHKNKGRKGLVVLSLLLSAMFIVGSGATAFAAGNATSKVGVTAYMRTLQETTDPADVYEVNLDVVDNVNVFRMTPEEMETAGIELVAVEPDGVTTMSTVKYFDWNVAPGTIAASNNFLKLKDKTIEVSAYITATSSVKMGVIEPDGTLVYAYAPANKSTLVRYTTTRLGYYKAAVYNITSADANAAGYYTK